MLWLVSLIFDDKSGLFDLKKKTYKFWRISSFIETFLWMSFETKDWVILYPLKFLWNGKFYRDFGEKLARASIFWKSSFEYNSLIRFLYFFFMRSNQTFFMCSVILCLHLHFYHNPNFPYFLFFYSYESRGSWSFSILEHFNAA